MGAVGAQFIAPTLVREASDTAEPQIWTAINVTAQQDGVSSIHRGLNDCPHLIVQFFTDLMGDVGAQFIAPTLVREASDNAEPQI